VDIFPMRRKVNDGISDYLADPMIGDPAAPICFKNLDSKTSQHIARRKDPIGPGAPTKRKCVSMFEQQENPVGPPVYDILLTFALERQSVVIPDAP